jgi:L-lactate dehydrogenase complex protein LldG
MPQTGELTELATRFKERAERIGAKMLVAEDWGAAARLVAETVSAKGGGVVVAPPGIASDPAFKTALGDSLKEATDTASITGATAGISAGEFGISETGSVAYAVNNPLERQVAMLSAIHFALLNIEKLVPDLDAAGAQVKKLQTEQGRRYISFVTGPSRTADIERVLTIGVQGPKELYVVLINHRDEG